MADGTSSKGLLEPILENGIQNTHYFNGRLLTAQDLQVDQTANRRQHQQLGRGIGEGIIDGFEVRLVSGGTGGQPPVLAIERGLALSQTGQVVVLPDSLPELLLARRNPDVLPTAGVFAECDRPTNESVTTTASVHVLTVTLASGFSGKAPKRGFGENGKVEGCGSRYAGEGVYFRLVELKLSDLTFLASSSVTVLTNLMNKTDAASLSMLRNLLAHLCYGTGQLSEFQIDPFRLVSKHSPYASYGALDDLRSRGVLTPCDVPLALVFWSATGVRFADMWSVRRRVMQPVVADPWPLHAGERRLAEAEAMFLHFQEQLLLLASETNLASIKATDRFRFLPAAGYLPIDSGEFTVASFFQALQRVDLDVDSAFLRRIVHDSWYADPIDLTDPPPILIYRSAEHADYILFARGERQPAAVVEPPAEPDDSTVKTGTFVVDLSIENAVRKAGKQASGSSSGTTTEAYGIIKESEAAFDTAYYADLMTGEAELADSFVKVFARDKQENTYNGRYVETRYRVRDRQSKDVSFQDGVARFRIDNVPPGGYHVICDIKGFEHAEQYKEIAAGKTVYVTFNLVAKRVRETKPPSSFDASWSQDGWYARGTLLTDLVHYPLPEKEKLPKLIPLDDPRPPEVETWLTEMAAWLHVTYPEAAIDPGDVQILVDESHTPDATPDDAYAYIAFGDRGAYAPLVLTPTDRALDRDIALDKSKLAGVDRDVAQQLEEIGVTSVDVLSSSWTGLVSGALGIDTQAASALVEEARAQVGVLQDSLFGLSGVDDQVDTALTAKGFTTPVAIANATATDLVTAVGQDKGMTTAFAERLISEARQTVPADQWSLTSQQLQLKDQEIASLNQLGVTTLQKFKDLAGTEAGVGLIATALAISNAQVTTLNQQISIKTAVELATDRVAAAAVTNVFGVTRDTAKALAKLGFATVGQLANADSVALAALFGGQRDAAQLAIDNAKLKVGLQ
jgi:hypothetical protein